MCATAVGWVHATRRYRLNRVEHGYKRVEQLVRGARTYARVMRVYPPWNAFVMFHACVSVSKFLLRAYKAGRGDILQTNFNFFR